MIWDKSLLWAAGLMAATTIGAGLFSLPFIFQSAGLPLAVFFLLALSAAVHFAHRLYLRALAAEGGKKRLLGLAAEHYGPLGRQLGLLVVVGGLLLALVIYLILISSFIYILAPDWIAAGSFIFWLSASLVILLRLRRLVAMEVLGSVFLFLVVGWIFFYGAGGLAPEKFNLLAASPADWILPFAPILFSLAGWTAVEPVYDYARKRGLSLRESGRAMGAGTFITALAYALFVLGIVGAGATITPDTVSGLSGAAAFLLLPVAVLGILAMWTSYVPIGLEIRKSLETDLGWPVGWSASAVFFLPPLLFYLGLSDFLKAIGLVGGVFLGLEYVLILLVSRRTLRLRSGERRLSSFLVMIFILAAIYEIYHFATK